MPLPLALGALGLGGYGAYKLLSNEMANDEASRQAHQAQAANLEQEAATRKAALDSQEVADYLIRRKSQPQMEDLDAPRNPAALDFLTKLGGPGTHGATIVPQGLQPGQPLMVGKQRYDVPPGVVARPGDLVVYGEERQNAVGLPPGAPPAFAQVSTVRRVIPREVADNLIEIGRQLKTENLSANEISYNSPILGGGVRNYGSMIVPQGAEAHVPVGSAPPGELPSTKSVMGPERPKGEIRDVFSVTTPDGAYLYRASTGKVIAGPFGGTGRKAGDKEDREQAARLRGDLGLIRKDVLLAFGITVDPLAQYQPTDPWVADALTLAYGAYNALRPTNPDRAVQAAVTLGQMARSARDKKIYRNLSQYLKERARVDPKSKPYLDWFLAQQGDLTSALEQEQEIPVKKTAPKEKSLMQRLKEAFPSVMGTPEPTDNEEEE